MKKALKPRSKSANRNMFHFVCGRRHTTESSKSRVISPLLVCFVWLGLSFAGYSTLCVTVWMYIFGENEAPLPPGCLVILGMLFL